MRLENKIVIITGAGGGIGKETAILFAREGAKVVVADLNEKSGFQTVKKLGRAQRVFC
jgi:3-oxoacyl-[acyl-carrier protein] reductase